MEDPLHKRSIQHFLVPLLQPLGLGDLLVLRVAVEDVVVPFTGGARPDMTIHIAAWDQGWEDRF